ncbi:uncharacterized protein STEHIDRAFT_154969 [Stereum hirsutum FP-91666 SS1]|uniref:uncharacterized protein n=1 Tax=Stereum hirsutum (strain FP-91666) TaxID=721885 RepID=UPI0004409E0C|nr:uncharacterized protein STEHIDRAFT_154969 [Stereum hirsutum FP-91666 SS1]EIM89292.1 hypothetical protein STEHIDRAFT_154969 [Stereum hirsutum FP-91666 SS1]
MLYNPQRLPRIRSLIQPFLDFTHVTTNPPPFYHSIWLAEIRPAALPAGHTDTYCPHPGRDWIRDLNNYLQSTGQAADLCWCIDATDQYNTGTIYVTAKLGGVPIASGEGTTRSAAKSKAAQAYLTSIGL